jgi:hypothetical protein
MSQLEKLVDLLNEFGFGDDGQACWPSQEKYSVRTENAGQVVTIGCGERGYAGFLASFKFDADGKFLEHEIYE